MFQRGFEFIKKKFIYKEKFFFEKSGAATKLKLVTKIKNYSQLYFGT